MRAGEIPDEKLRAAHRLDSDKQIPSSPEPMAAERARPSDFLEKSGGLDPPKTRKFLADNVGSGTHTILNLLLY